MNNPAVAQRHPLWLSRNLFWVLTVFVGILLLIPPQFQGKAVSFFILGSWLLAAATWIIFIRYSGRFEGLACGPPLIALMASFGLALVWSQNPAVSINPCAQELALLLLFVTTMGVARNPRSVRTAMCGLVIVGLLLALYAVYQHIHGLAETYQHLFNYKPPQGLMEREMAGRLASHRAFSLFTYPNILAGFLVMVLPVSFSLMHIAGKRLSIWIRGIGLAVLVMGLYATGSVGGWLTAAAGSVIYMILVKKYFEKKISSPLVKYILLAGGFLTLAGLSTLIMIRTPQGLLADLGARAMNWGSTLQMIWNHPITGVGPGVFGSLFPEYQAEGGYYVRFAHNILLHRWAETGLAGLAALVWLGTVVIMQIKKNLSRSLSKAQRFLALGLISGLSAGFLHACVDVDLNFLKTSVIFWFFLGTLLGLIMPGGRAGFKNAWHRENSVIIRQTRPLVQMGLCLIAFLVLWKGGKSLIVEGVLFFGTGALAVVFLLGQARASASWSQWVKKIPLRWPLGLVFIWCTFSALVSLHPAAAIPGLTLAITGLLCYVITVLTPRSGILLVNLLAPAAVLTAGAALIQLLLNPGIRVTAWWPNPNLLAAFLSMGLLSNLVPLFLGSQSAINRMVSILSSLIIFTALLATGSLGGTLNCLAGLIILAAWLQHRQPRRLPLAGLALILMLAGLFLLPLAAGRRISQMDQYHAQAYERIQIARAAVKMVWSRPFTGFGPGNFKQAFEQFSFPNIRGLSRFGKLASFAHNEILQLGAIAGIPGLLFLLWMIWTIRVYFMRQWRTAGPKAGQGPEIREERARIIAWSALAGAGVQALVDFNWHLPALWIWGMMLLGIALAPAVNWRRELFIPARNAESWFHRWDAWSRQIMAVLLFFIVSIAALAAIRPLVSQYLMDLGEAHRYKQNLQAASRSFEQALVVHPFSSRAFDQLGQVHTDFFAAIGLDNGFQLSQWAFNQALTLDKMDAYIHRHLGRLYGIKAARYENPERQRQFDRAARQYRLAIEKAPHKAFLHFELGNLLRDAERMDAAERAWTEAVGLEPNYAAAWSNLGVVQEIRDDPVAAESSFRRALELQSLVPQARGKYEIELLSVNKAVLHYNLGRLLECHERWKEAGEEYSKALELEPDNKPALKRLKALPK